MFTLTCLDSILYYADTFLHTVFHWRTNRELHCWLVLTSRTSLSHHSSHTYHVSPQRNLYFMLGARFTLYRATRFHYGMLFTDELEMMDFIVFTSQWDPQVLRTYGFSITVGASFTTDLFPLLSPWRHLIICKLIWGYLIAIRRLAPATINLLSQEEFGHDQLWFALCKLRTDSAAWLRHESQRLDVVSRGCAKLDRTFRRL